MKHAVIGIALAVLAATSSVSQAADAPAGGAAGNVQKASTLANGNVATVAAIGLGAATALAVAVVGVSDNGNTSTSTATATTR